MKVSAICHECGAEAQLVRERRTVKLGRRDVLADDEFMRCAGCGEEFYLPGQLAATHDRAADIVRNDEGKLSPDRIRKLREKLGISQASLEQLLDAGAKTVVRWESGLVIPNGVANTLLRVLEAIPFLARILAKWHGVELAPPDPAETAELVATREALVHACNRSYALNDSDAALIAFVADECRAMRVWKGPAYFPQPHSTAITIPCSQGERHDWRVFVDSAEFRWAGRETELVPVPSRAPVFASFGTDLS
jgi:putative zinc finger/helix-turn-helix YgiT family protein